MPLLKPHFQKTLLEAGCDEAGRGCLAGPVVGAAVILPKKARIKGLNDSKLLTEKKRYELRTEIEAKALAFAVGFVGEKEIDKVNILNASFKAVHKALRKLKIVPEFILMDGNKFKPFKNIPFECIVKGDGKYQSIAAASVLAKTYRDEYMQKLALKYPYYGWETNKGYATLKHRRAIYEHGECVRHRQSFQLLSYKQGDLFE